MSRKIHINSRMNNRTGYITQVAPSPQVSSVFKIPPETPRQAVTSMILVDGALHYVRIEEGAGEIGLCNPCPAEVTRIKISRKFIERDLVSSDT
jgi:hypothetical protein